MRQITRHQVDQRINTPSWNALALVIGGEAYTVPAASAPEGIPAPAISRELSCHRTVYTQSGTEAVL